MNLMQLLQQRSQDGAPVRAGLIGAGKFGSMFLCQVPNIPGLDVSAVADLSVDHVREACRHVGWSEERLAKTQVLDNGLALCARDDVDVVIEATGNPVVGIEHALAAMEHGKHVIMVNVEADVLAGPALARRAHSAGVVYSMAYGDQPALVSEMVDWVRATGFRVTTAGKGTKYLPHYHTVTPDDVWTHYGLTNAQAEESRLNAKMFNSFLDGTKSAIEMCAIANACDLDVPHDGLGFPACGVDDLAQLLRPRSVGGVMAEAGQVEVVASLERDGRPVFRDLRWGVYVVFEAVTDYAASCLTTYGLPTDTSGRYAAMYKPFHLIGLELSLSVLNAALRHEATGSSRHFRGDAVSIAKKAMRAGDWLDGEGGYTVWGKALPATSSLEQAALPIGLAHQVALRRDVKAGQVICFDDVDLPDSNALQIRRESERLVG